MPVILRDVPFVDAITSVEVQGQTFPVLPLQMLVWVSLRHKGLRDFHARTPRFPAIYDTGFNETLVIHRTQLQHFAGLLPQHLTSLNLLLHAQGRRIPVHAATLWLHRNRPGQRDQFLDAPPFLLELPRGIGICSDDDGFPRLPLLGQRAFLASGLQITIDYRRCRLSARTPRKFWFF